MDELFRVRRDKLRYSALASIEKRVGPVARYVLLLAVFASTLAQPGILRHFLFYICVGMLICGTLIYIYFYKCRSSTHRVVVITLSSCLDVLCISLIYCILAGSHLTPIVFLFLLLPILRLALFYPAVSEFLLAAGLSSGVFLLTIAALAPQQLALLWFWVYFGSMWPTFGLGMVIVDKLLDQLNRSVRDHQLILQAFQMVSSLIEMAESTAHLREKSAILQKSVEIISRVMTASSCAVWSFQDSVFCPAASDGLEIGRAHV